MIALLTHAPNFCPNCGTALDVLGGAYRAADWLAHCSHVCPGCGLHFQLVDEDDALAAAEASGGDLARYHT